MNQNRIAKLSWMLVVLGGQFYLAWLLPSESLRAQSVDAQPYESRISDRSFVAEYDGTKQKYVLVVPPGFDSRKPVSVLIALHGHGSDRWQFVKQNRGECAATRDVASAHKMLLVSPDYRARTSWMGPAAEADMVQMIKSLKQQFKVERIILCGGSMGGTGALTFTALHPKLIDGVVSLNGTANLVEYERFQEAIAASFGGNRQQVPDEYRKRSAEFAYQRFTMPLAATTGGRDKVVPPDSVLRLIAKLKPRRDSHVLSIHRPAGGHATNYADSRRALEFVIAASAKERSSETGKGRNATGDKTGSGGKSSPSKR